MQRSKAYRAILKLLLMAKDKCRSYHTKAAAMDSIVEAVMKPDTVDWETFDADYDGYDGSARCGPVDEETAKKGLGKKGWCPIPEVICRRCVPIGLLDDIENWEPNNLRSSLDLSLTWAQSCAIHWFGRDSWKDSSCQYNRIARPSLNQRLRTSAPSSWT